jgi:hypothetical protein
MILGWVTSEYPDEYGGKNSRDEVQGLLLVGTRNLNTLIVMCRSLIG